MSRERERPGDRIAAIAGDAGQLERIAYSLADRTEKREALWRELWDLALGSESALCGIAAAHGMTQSLPTEKLKRAEELRKALGLTPTPVGGPE